LYLAKESYERVLQEHPKHPKVLQQLGWLYHHHYDTALDLGNQDLAISYLLKSIEADASDGQTWYLLGRCYMAQQSYRKAYESYQQAVYQDAKNPTFWCSIGVLYYQINQYRDALDAYSRAIRLNPYLSEVWYDLGTLYECCNQLSDALDAYNRASELDPNNKHIQQRLNMLHQLIENECQSDKIQVSSSKHKETLKSSPLPSTSHISSLPPLPPNTGSEIDTLPSTIHLLNHGEGSDIDSKITTDASTNGT